MDPEGSELSAAKIATKFSSAPKVNMKTSMVTVAGSESRLMMVRRSSFFLGTSTLGARTKAKRTRPRPAIAAAAAYSALKPKPSMSERPSAGAMAEASAVAMPK